jgi:hypothetical protein
MELRPRLDPFASRIRGLFVFRPFKEQFMTKIRGVRLPSEEDAKLVLLASATGDSLSGVIRTLAREARLTIAPPAISNQRNVEAADHVLAHHGSHS